MTDTERKPSAFQLFACKCPRCRKGNMFSDSNPWHLKNTMKMDSVCTVCNQPLNIEIGFYYGSSYVSYALSVALSAASFIVSWFIIGAWSEKILLYWLIVNAIGLVLVQPYLMRVSRTLWLAFFVRYDRNWRTIAPQSLERTNSAQENNW